MAQLLIWGDGLDGAASALADARPQRVRSLGELRSAVAAHGGALVLAEPACLEAERQALEAWLHEGGSGEVLLLAAVDAARADDVLARLPFVDDVAVRPLSAGQLRHKLVRGAETIHARRGVRQLDGALRRKREELSELNKIGVALSAERDIDALLELILAKSREITCADAGSLYLVERAANGEGRDRLRFKLTQNDSVEVPFEESEIALDESSIAGYVALSGRVVNVGDAYRLPKGSAFRISRSFDERSGYRTKSMLVVPMLDHEDAVIGVVQLINKKRDRSATLQPVSLVEEHVVPFGDGDEELAGSLASQAAVAFENAKLLQDIRDLFDSFVYAAVTAIEQRDPVTSGHSERVATLTVKLAERVDAVSTGPLSELHFSYDQLQELRYAALLHDFGKVGVKEKVLIKERKLYGGQLDLIRQRFEYIDKALEAEHLERRLDALSAGRLTPELAAAIEAEYAARRAEVWRMFEVVVQANEPTVLDQDTYALLQQLPQRTYRGRGGDPQPYLTADELSVLAIRRGSLTETERREIESHVTHTYEFLSEIPWTGEFRRIPEIAWAHHEKLDGSGYPRGLKAAQIPPQSRMMTIADIYDALVAQDRPYKPAREDHEALAILERDAGTGLIDAQLLAVFIEAGVYDDAGFKAQVRPRRQ
jgi:HD-GYP domain-containing protein (c-di-GMP phosphodiesterase class II)